MRTTVSRKFVLKSRPEQTFDPAGITGFEMAKETSPKVEQCLSNSEINTTAKI
jgi:hypothetical protein